MAYAVRMSPEYEFSFQPTESRQPNQKETIFSDEGDRAAIILCAITNFTRLRRQLGQLGWQAAMDRIVSSLCERVPGSTVERIAPDCIQLCLTPPSSGDLYRTLQNALEHSAFLVENFDLRIDPGLAFGAAISIGDCDPITLQEHAERALADACGGRRIVLVKAEPGTQTFEEIALLRDLPMAVASEELFLLYQPKIHVRDQSVSSAEALIRWMHPVHGLIMPDAFIEAADQSGDILPIALWTLRRVIADQATLVSRGHALRIFVNISGRLLTDRSFIDTACALIRDSGAQIGFEITETSVIRDPDLAISNLEQCAAIGIELAIDDYGSGLSSLAYLKRLPARELKIDKQFIIQLTSSHRDPLIVRSTIDLAHALDMQVTAEGVETPAALALLTVMGCEMVQGYLISPPIKLDAFATYLDEYRYELLQPDVPPTVIRPASFWKRA
jgi:diguanylate cyclase